MMALSKALLVVRDRRPPVAIPVMFNPPEYELKRTNVFAEIGVPGLGSAPLQFVRGGADTLTMELLVDTTDSPGMDARVLTLPLTGLMDVRRETHAPARLLFLWGSLAFPCVLDSLTQRFVQFTPVGTPVRCQLSVTLREDQTLAELVAGTPLESPDRTKTHLMRDGDSLPRLAAEHYDDPTLWRVIATANAIDDPLHVTTGTVLILPPLPAHTRRAGDGHA